MNNITLSFDDAANCLIALRENIVSTVQRSLSGRMRGLRRGLGLKPHTSHSRLLLSIARSRGDSYRRLKAAMDKT